MTLRVPDFTLSEEGWDQVVLPSSSPRVGSGWTDSAQQGERRHLEGRSPLRPHRGNTNGAPRWSRPPPFGMGFDPAVTHAAMVFEAVGDRIATPSAP